MAHFYIILLSLGVCILGVFAKEPCSLKCPDDYFLDTDNCKCMAKVTLKGVICPDVVCPLEEFWACKTRVLDSIGCPTCGCVCPETQQPCPSGCKYGTEIGLDNTGCKVCKCKEKLPCGPTCAIACEFGRVFDARGCPTCQCNQNPGLKCPPTCDIFCPFGKEINSRGCELCRCKRPVRIIGPPRCYHQCALYCPKGEHILDAWGCRTCRCKNEILKSE